MILASVAVGRIRDPIQDAAISSGLSNYLVYNEGSGGGGGGGGGDSTEVFTQAIVNAIVIVSVIAAATFVLVLCYYFRCIKLMIVYLIFASINLLGYTGGFMVVSAIQLWHIIVDWGTLGFIMFNFAVGGAVAVFWQKGVPRVITQGYLIAVSVIMAWILTKLPEWTSWVLLVVLALYDLCAVLTPCGPLKALIALAQVRKDPIPGLLYEANVGSSDPNAVRDTFVTEHGAGGRPKRQQPHGSAVRPVAPAGEYQAPSVPAATAPTIAQRVPSPQYAAQPAVESSRASRQSPTLQVQDLESGLETVSPSPAKSTPIRRSHGSTSPPATSTSHGKVVVGNALHSVTNAGRPPHAALENVEAHLDAQRMAASQRALSPEELAALSEAEAVAAAAEADEADAEQDKSIKLGLGDFVFYSVLVSRAALFDVATMAATFVSVIVGLGGTLFLLGVFKRALPALPISIFLGVAFYFLTRLVVTPMIVELSVNGVAI